MGTNITGGIFFGPEYKSKEYPTRSQLIRSPFLSELYALEDGLSFNPDNLEGDVEDLVSQIEELRDQCQESLDNMPDNLRESSDSGNTLQERIDVLDGWIGDLQGVDLDLLDAEEQAEVDALPEDERDARAMEIREEKRSDGAQEIVDKLMNLSSGL